jgi:hypothetical protein
MSVKMKREEIKILLIEPLGESAETLKRDLQSAFPEGCNIVHITDADKALGMIYMEPMDIILADVTVPDPSVIQHVSRLIAAGLLVVALTDPRGTSAGLRAATSWSPRACAGRSATPSSATGSAPSGARPCARR